MWTRELMCLGDLEKESEKTPGRGSEILKSREQETRTESKSKPATRKRKGSTSEEPKQKKAKVDQVPYSGKCPWVGCNHFEKYANLKVHYRKHTGERPFKCKICGKAFSHRTHLKTHTRIHTGERPFKCPLEGCGKSFYSHANIANHARSHSKEKTHRCPINGCGQLFAGSSPMLRHIKSHTGERPAVCNFDGCGKSFKTNGELESHQTIHTGDRPYPCMFEGCGHKCSKLGNLKTHFKAMHTPEGSARQKKKETRYFEALEAAGEIVDRREYYHDFSSFGQTFARSDGLSQKDGFKVLHELQEHQHKYYPIRGDPDRAIKIYASMRGKRDTEPFIIANVNPDAMKVNGVLFKVPYSKRVAWVVKYINDPNLKFKWPVKMAYFWYDQTDGIPDVWRHPEFPKSMLHLCVNATPIIPDESAKQVKIKSKAAQKDSES